MTVSTAQFNNVIAPGLFKVSAEETRRWESRIPIIYDQTPSRRNYEESQTIAGFGLFAVKPEGGAHGYEDILQAYYKKTAHKTYSRATRYTREMAHDDLYGLFGGKSPTMASMRRSKAGTITKMLTNAAMETREVRAAELLNTGTGTTVYTIGNGGALFRNNHPLRKGGTSSNLGTAAALSEASLQDLIGVMDSTLDEAGKKERLTAKNLIVPSGLRFKAKELIRSSHDPEGDTSHINALQDENLKVVPWRYLTSTTGWGLQDPNASFRPVWFESEALSMSREGDFDTDDVKIKMAMRFSVHVNDWRGLAWNAGT